jgi:hypothetical protein
MNFRGTTVTNAITSRVAEALILLSVASATTLLITASPAAADVLLAVCGSKIALLRSLNNTITAEFSFRCRIRIGDAGSNRVGVGSGIGRSIGVGNSDGVALRNSN